jgi:hypothetical protein
MPFVRRNKQDARPSHDSLAQKSERARGIGAPLLICDAGAGRLV